MGSFESIGKHFSGVNLKWTEAFNDTNMQDLVLWAQPINYGDLIKIQKSNKQMLELLTRLQEKKLVVIPPEAQESLTRKDKIYSHILYLCLDNSELKLLCSYEGTTFKADSDYKTILPTERQFRDKLSGQKAFNLLPKGPRFSWKSYFGVFINNRDLYSSSKAESPVEEPGISEPINIEQPQLKREECGQPPKRPPFFPE